MVGLFNVLLFLNSSDVFSGEDGDVEGISLKLVSSDDMIKYSDQRIKIEGFTTLPSLSVDCKPDLASG